MLEPSSSYNSPMLRFMIMFNSCLSQWVGDILKMQGWTEIHLLPGLLMWECHHPRSLPYIFENGPIVKYCLNFSFVFSAPLPAWRNLFSASGIFCGGKYQPGCTGIFWLLALGTDLKSWKALLLYRKKFKKKCFTTLDFPKVRSFQTLAPVR